MNLAGRALEVHVPEFVRRRALRELFQATAEALGEHAPELDGRSSGELLDLYARFTTAWAESIVAGGRDVEPVRKRLHEAASSIGARLRHELNVTSTADAMAAARAVYSILHIDFAPTTAGARINTCFFSRYYSAPVCRLMSGLDEGLVAGLSGGGRLEFRGRMTEGAPWCAATFAEPLP